MMSQVYRHRGSITLYIIVAVLAAVLAVFGVQVLELSESRERAEAEATEQEAVNAQQGQAIDQLVADSNANREQLEALGQEPVAPPPEERIEDLPDVGASDPPAIDRPVAPSAAQVRTAVAAVFTANPQMPEDQVVAATTAWLTANPPAPGEDGTNGEPGRPPTAEENFIAVSAYCADDACRGPAGEDGTDGDDAPPVTDEQIAARVAAYCDEHGECQGPPGRDGTDGQPGRGVIDVDCRGDDLVFTFDQPPLEDIIANGCRPDAEPPTETPDPTAPPTGIPEP